MTDPETGAEALGLPDALPPGPTAEGGAEPAPPREAAIAPGQTWGSYRIGEPVAGGPAGCFHAMNIASMEAATVVVRPVTEQTPNRRAAWMRLSSLPAGDMVALVEAQEKDGTRVEVFSPPPGPNLREWMSAHQPGLPEMETIVRQLTLVLEALHDAGVAHLRVRPENVYVREEEQHLVVVLGGLQEATITDRADLVPSEADPYFVPPEAGGLFKHRAGPALGGWDWWGLGRIVQELVHGQHVYGLLFERDVAGNPPELRPRAEAMLLEREATGIRAGAVELLPDSVSPRLRTLLRGLLTSARDARWSGAQVHAWLRKEAAPDRYDLPRDARLFVWRKQSFTVPEAAEFFSQPDHFMDGQAQLFPQEDDPGSFLAFLQEVPACRGELERVRTLLDAAKMAAWQPWSLALRRSVVAGLAWLALAPNGPRRGLRVRRWRVEAAGLRELLTDAPPAEALGLAQVMMVKPFLRLAEPLDAGAVRVLEQLAAVGQEAIRRATEAGWVTAEDPEGQTRLLALALENAAELNGRRERLRAAYATNRHPELAAWLAAERPSAVELVLLAFTGERAREAGYVTHAEWNEERAGALLAEAARLAAGLFWRRLERTMRGAPVLLGSAPWALGAAALPVALAASVGAWPWAAGFAGLALGSRLAALGHLRRIVRTVAPAADAWSWRDTAARCRREAAAALGERAAAPWSDLSGGYARVTAELAALPLTPRPVPRSAGPRLWEFWVVSVTGSAGSLALGLALVFLPSVMVLPKWQPPAPAEPGAVAPPADVVTQVNSSLREETGPDGRPGLFEAADDGFGNRWRGPLRRWELAEPSAAPALGSRRRTPVTSDEAAVGQVAAELLLEPYPRQNLAVTLLVRVPLDTPEGWGAVLYDTRRRALLDRRTFHLRAGPVEPGWYEIDGRRAVFLGEPPPLLLEISLAQARAGARIIPGP